MLGSQKAENREELQNALQEAYRYDTRAIVEQGIEAREIEVAVLEMKMCVQQCPARSLKM